MPHFSLLACRPSGTNYLLLELLLLLPDKKHGWEVQGKVLGACLYRMSWLCIGEGVRLGGHPCGPLHELRCDIPQAQLVHEFHVYRPACASPERAAPLNTKDSELQRRFDFSQLRAQQYQAVLACAHLHCFISHTTWIQSAHRRLLYAVPWHEWWSLSILLLGLFELFLKSQELLHISLALEIEEDVCVSGHILSKF